MALLPLLLVLVLAAAVACGAALLRGTDVSQEAAVEAARRHARSTSVAAVSLAGCAALGTAVTGVGRSGAPGSLGVVALLTPIAFGVAHTAVLLVGELTWPRPQGEVRRARLVRRGLLDAAPRWLVRTAAGALAAAVVTVTAGAALADPDGRSFTRETGSLTSSASPFPGWTYGRPASLGLLLLVAVTLAALHVVATRPAVATADERVEAAVRRASAHRVLRGATAAVLVTTGGLLLVGGMAVQRASAQGGPATVAATGVAVALLGLAGLVGGLVVLCVRAPGVRTAGLVTGAAG